MRVHVLTVKHTRLGEYCTNTYAQPVLLWASLLATQKLNVDQKPKKKIQKTNKFG